MDKQSKNVKKLNGNELPFNHTEFNNKSNLPKILILGTRVTEKSIKAGYYYFGLTERENCFWSVISYCFDDKDFMSRNVNTVKNALYNHNLVVSDLIYNCDYLGSSDNETIQGTEEQNPDLVSLIENANYVILNGGFNNKKKTGTLNYFHKFLGEYIDEKTIKNKNYVLENGYLIINKHKIPYLSLDSTSGGNRKDPNDIKASWKKYIDLFIAGKDIERK